MKWPGAGAGALFPRPSYEEVGADPADLADRLVLRRALVAKQPDLGSAILLVMDRRGGLPAAGVGSGSFC